MRKPQVLVIVGPTASGKSALAVRLAKKYSGEIISADSRQVYRGLDIGSGKINKTEMRDVPHHLLDVANPKRVFTVAQYQKLAQKKIQEIIKHGKLPIIVGGTGFYIQSVVDNLVLPEVKPNKVLRTELLTLTTTELFKKLKKLDPARAKNIDAKNPRRLIRAIEIAKAVGHLPVSDIRYRSKSLYNFIQLGIRVPAEELRTRINLRLFARIREGLVGEVQKLHAQGLSWKRLENLGLEYKYVALFLQKKLSRPQMLKQLERAINQYAKRQMIWFKRDKRIIWASKSDKIGPADRRLGKLLTSGPKAKSRGSSAGRPRGATTSPRGRRT